MAPFLPPECLQEIFINLVDDIPTLNSIIFVNKTWFENGIQILWRKPFSYDNDWNNLYKIIPIYLSFLSKETKDKLEIHETSLSIKPSKDYISFIRELDLYNLIMQLCEWMVKSKYINTIPRILIENENDGLELICQEITEKISLKRTMNIIKEIMMIISKNSKINHLEITMGNMDSVVFDYLDYEYFSDIFNSIPSNWFKKISNLEYDGQYLLQKFTDHAINIDTLSFGFHTFIPDFIPSISSLISVQKNLVNLELYLGYYDNEISKINILEIISTLTKTCVNSLKSLSLASGGDAIVQNVKELEMLSQCNHLERLHLRNIEFTMFNQDNFLIEFSSLISLELFDVRMISQYSEDYLVKLIEQIMKNSKLINLDLEPFIGDKYFTLVEFIPRYCSNLIELTLKINDSYENIMITILSILPFLNKLRILRITEDWGGIQLDENCCFNLKQVIILLKNYDDKHEQIIKSFSLERKKVIKDIFVSTDHRPEITINWR
ncbi:15680_t:CDS:2 [Gigaspora margarita]|uniref:15680_t:CDS:1 n=1 Tax=Gigaspora margarita TaxID=4874 RepID=A0ABN7UPH0_GIGMA|nr:15680_t:CDS:2 [Gigaspora margarita]